MSKLPGFIEKITGAKVRSTTDEGAVMEMLDAFGLLPSASAPLRDYDAEAAAMQASEVQLRQSIERDIARAVIRQKRAGTSNASEDTK